MKKLTAILLAVLMAALPLFAMAESPLTALEQAIEAGKPMEVSVSFKIGEALAANADTKPLADLLDALAFTGSFQDGAESFGKLQMMLSGNEVLNFAAMEKGDELCLSSNLLGKDAVSLKADELEALLPRIVDALVKLNILTENDAKMVKDMLASMIEEAKQPAAEMEITPESIEALAKVFTDLGSRCTITDVTAQPKGCDPAEKMATMTLTGEDVVQVWEAYIAFFKANPALMSQMQAGFAVSGKMVNVEQELDKMLSKLKENVGNIEDIPMTLYVDKEGIPVYGTMAMAVKEDDERHTVDVETFRLTTGEGVSYSMTITDKEDDKDDEAVVSTVNVLIGEARDMMKFDVVETETGKDDELVMSLTAELTKNRTETTVKDQATMEMTVYDDGKTDTLRIAADIDAVTTDDGVTIELPITFAFNAEEPQLTVNLSVKPCEAMTAPADVVAPAQMSDDELSAWVVQVIQNASTEVVTMVQALPSSILMLMMGGN